MVEETGVNLGGSLATFTTATGSLTLGLAVLGGRLAPAEAFDLSRIDEEFQAENWGRDEDADKAAAGRKQAMLNAERLLALLAS